MPFIYSLVEQMSNIALCYNGDTTMFYQPSNPYELKYSGGCVIKYIVHLIASRRGSRDYTQRAILTIIIVVNMVKI